jgi:hypothetical protein
VTVTGVKNSDGATEFTVEPTASFVYMNSNLAFPPFAEGATVGLSAAGGDFSAFTISAKGINAMAGAPATLPIEKDKAASVTWTAAGAGSASTIEINLDISQHGGTKGMIVCNVPDTGSLQIPANLITALINLGVAGFPTIAIARKSVGSATVSAGRVDLVLTSSAEVSVEIPGLTSCNDEIPCPSGKVCQADYTCL